jgi:uncharacterized protein (TIGR02145 family)
MNKATRFTNLTAIIGIIVISISGCKKQDSFTTHPVNGVTIAIFNSSKTYGSMTDQDGNIYRTITIGTQTWMAENLRTTIFRNGDTIPKVIDNTAWQNINSSAYCNGNNLNNDDSITSYGRLYNWFAVNDNRKLAPKGWHVPSNDEWTTLLNYLGGKDDAGGKLKEAGTTHWLYPNACATNESGFTALPGINRSFDGTFSILYARYWPYWWSSNSDYQDTAPSVGLDFEVCLVQNGGYANNHFGYFVRCVKD